MPARNEVGAGKHEHGRSLFGTFGNPLTTDLGARVGQRGRVANTNIVWHGGRLMALEEGHHPFEMTATGPWRRPSAMCGPTAGKVTAHPKI
jgi:carotenoid cleavage dioxygenase-like enzyme